MTMQIAVGGGLLLLYFGTAISILAELFQLSDKKADNHRKNISTIIGKRM